MITFIIPTYNEEKYIGKCLDSLFKQKGKTEAIVVDSYSKDKTAKIAREHGARVIFDPVGRTGRSRDKAMRAGKGSILISCSADVIYPEGWLERITAPIITKKADMVIGSLYVHKPNAIEKIGCHIINSVLLPATSVLKLMYANADNMAIEREFYYRMGGFPHVMTAEDAMLLKAAARNNGRVIYKKDAFAYTSPRRVREWGYLKFTIFHTKNFLEANLLNKTHDAYEPIR